LPGGRERDSFPWNTARMWPLESVRIEPWADADLELLRRVNTPRMRADVGGIETDEQLLLRHRRWLGFVPAGVGRMFRIVLGPDQVAAGTIGYAERNWKDGWVYEMGWNVLPPFQGRGIASHAVTMAAAQAAADGKHRYLHAYPSVDNPASNAVCRKAGFELLWLRRSAI
jgi:RimJ/RimL family protein N-acetyltransferase